MKIFSRIGLFIFIFIICYISTTRAQQAPPFLDNRTGWVDSVFSTLDLDAKIGQLFMVAAYSNRNDAHRQEIMELVKQYKIGGLIFFQGGPVRQAILHNEYQSAADVPLLVAMDCEWGIGMRLDSTIRYPYQMALGAVQNDELIYNMGREIAAQFKSALFGAWPYVHQTGLAISSTSTVTLIPCSSIVFLAISSLSPYVDGCDIGLPSLSVLYLNGHS